MDQQQTLALDNITLNLEGPSITGIIGPNGAGKSTLIKALIGIIPHSGKILFNKQPIRQQLNRISYVAQKADIDFNFPITVRECISLGLYPKTKFFKRLSKSDWSKVTDALTLLGLNDLAHRQISQLSGGQFQRVLIARCLVQEVYCSIVRNLLQAASAIAPARLWFFIILRTFRSSAAIKSWFSTFRFERT